MTKRDPVKIARKSFPQAKIELVDARLVAAEGLATSGRGEVRDSCHQLIARLGGFLNQLQRLRRRLG